VVALGMMVDNAIVVADNYTVRLGRGMKPLEAAIDSAAGPSFFWDGEYDSTITAQLSLVPNFYATLYGIHAGDKPAES